MNIYYEILSIIIVIIVAIDIIIFRNVINTLDNKNTWCKLMKFMSIKSMK